MVKTRIMRGEKKRMNKRDFSQVLKLYAEREQQLLIGLRWSDLYTRFNEAHDGKYSIEDLMVKMLQEFGVNLTIVCQKHLYTENQLTDWEYYVYPFGTDGMYIKFETLDTNLQICLRDFMIHQGFSLVFKDQYNMKLVFTNFCKNEEMRTHFDKNALILIFQRILTGLTGNDMQSDQNG